MRRAVAKSLQQPVKRPEAVGQTMNFGMGNLGGPGRLMQRLGVGSELYEDLLEFNPIHVEEFMARWSKRHSKVRLAHVILTAALKGRSYVLEGGTDQARKFHEEWVERVLPDVLKHVVDATWYGWQPFAIEWEPVDVWPAFSPYGLRDAWIPGRIIDLDPYWTVPTLNRFGEVESLDSMGQHYGPDQVLRMTWQQEGSNVFGDGQCICANPHWKGLSLESLWMLSYYERSVDPSRLAWAADLKYTIDGEERDLSEIMADGVDALGNGDSAGLPLKYDENGNPLAKVDLLEVADRADTWIKAKDSFGQDLWEAALVLPGIGLSSSGFDYASARQAEKQQVAILEHIGDLPVEAFNRRGGAIETAHRLNGLEGPCPRLVARPFKREQIETLREMLKPSMNEVVPEVDEEGKLTGRSYRPHDVLDYEAGFKRMELPTKPVRHVARIIDDAPAPGVGGRPEEPQGERADDRHSGLEDR